MIDNPRAGLLNFFHFVVEGAGRRGRIAALPGLVAVAACFGGCSPHSTSGTVEDSLTSGRISIVCAPEAMDLIAREGAIFQALYAQADVRIVPGTSREGIRALFAAECELAVSTRELRPEERAAAVRGRLELEGYRVARDAVIAVVHPDNPVENLTIEDLRRIYAGEAVRWSDIGGPPRDVRVVIQPPGSDITDFFVQEVMGARPIGATSIYVANDSEVVARVSGDPGAIGYVSLSARLVGVRSLRLSGLRGLPYWKPDLEAIYRGDYPLTRFINCFVRSAGPRLAHGFITFATSRDGQRIVQEAGLVPTAVPVRFVRRSHMMGTH